MSLPQGADSPLYMDHEHMALVATAVIVAMTGGFVRWLRRKGPRNFGRLLVALTTAGFLGLMSHYLTNWLELDVHLQFAVSGIAGYGGGVFLDDAVERVREMINTGAGTITKLGKPGEDKDK